MSKNINYIGECFGCGICALICPHNIINITLNSKGFYQPEIVDENRCVDCGACLSVCAYLNESEQENDFVPTFYSGWHLDEGIRSKSSSGGVASALAGFAFKNGYKFIGVRYNYDLDIAEHFIANNFEEQALSLGSKYIQSYPSGVNRDINKTDKYVVLGTPCYIDSLRRFIQKKNIEKNFVLVDFFCHGVPSILLWNKYLEQIKRQTGKIVELSFRSKINGWGNYTILAHGKDQIYQSSHKDLFYKFFLGDYCLNEACYNRCRYKMTNSSADLRIGDFWGGKFRGNKEGVSAIIALTEMGDEVIHNLSSYHLEVEERDVLLKGQMKQNARKPIIGNSVIRALQGSCSLKKINNFVEIYQFCRLPIRIWKKLTR